MTTLPANDAPVSYEAQIKPLFRERDRNAMLFAFDLWSYDDVRSNSNAIAGRLRSGTMPCDGPWPAEQVDAFRRWIDAGMPR